MSAWRELAQPRKFTRGREDGKRRGARPAARPRFKAGRVVGMTAQDAVRDLVIAAIDRVQASHDGIAKFRGIAVHDSRKDETFAKLEPFGAAEEAIVSIPLVRERFGESQTRRIALQFVYEFLDRVSEPEFDTRTLRRSGATSLRS